MPTEMFNSLKEDKKNTIVNAALEEFGSYGVINASTNNIVKKCGISKGSLFKYFETKDDLCCYLFDTVIAEMMADLSVKFESFSKEAFQRIIDYSAWEIGWYIDNPVKGRFILEFSREDDREFAKKREARYGKQSKNMYYELFGEVSEERLKVDRSVAVDLIKWSLEGYNKEFLGRPDIDNKSFLKLKEDYLTGVKKILNALKNGILVEA